MRKENAEQVAESHSKASKKKTVNAQYKEIFSLILALLPAAPAASPYSLNLLVCIGYILIPILWCKALAFTVFLFTHSCQIVTGCVLDVKDGGKVHYFIMSALKNVACCPRNFIIATSVVVYTGPISSYSDTIEMEKATLHE